MQKPDVLRQRGVRCSLPVLDYRIDLANRNAETDAALILGGRIDADDVAARFQDEWAAAISVRDWRRNLIKPFIARLLDIEISVRTADGARSSPYCRARADCRTR